ncbi:MAG: Abi family protein [Luteimonas sp.]
MNAPRNPPDKQALTFDEQIARLRERGMVIADADRARHYLSQLNYYRLRGYWMHLEVPSAISGEHQFREGTTFEQVIALYDFDRHLRLLVNDAVERVEVSLRTRWAHVLALHAGPCAHLQSSLFNDHHPKLLGRMERLYADRNDVFLRHYLERDIEPPIWVLCETLSLGDLSKWLGAIKQHSMRQAIATPYGLHETPLCSFIENLAYVRNLCAHHGRLWNRALIVGQPALPKNPAALVVQRQRDPKTQFRVYNTLVMLAWLMRRLSPGSDWHLRVREHAETRADLWEDMGFPADWQGFDLWQQAAP